MFRSEKWFCKKVTSHIQVLHIFFHLALFFFSRVHFHRGHNSPYADSNTVHRPSNGWFWPQRLQRLHCAILRWRYDVWACPRSSDCLISCLTRVSHSPSSGEVFVVQWERVRLSGKESEGAFTFQAALYKTGTITFSYREVGHTSALCTCCLPPHCCTCQWFLFLPVYQIPLPLDVMSSAEHPVKAGLSDAFMVTSPSPQSPGQLLCLCLSTHVLSHQS